MKTNNLVNVFFKVVVLAVMTMGLANCSKNNNSSTSVAYQCYTTAGQAVANSLCNTNSLYGSSYNTGYICRDASGNTVANTYCANYSAANGYYMNNGICYASNGQVATTSLCYSTGTTAGSCVGTYSNGYQTYQCGTMYDCGLNAQTGTRGVQLYNSAGQLVMCY